MIYRYMILDDPPRIITLNLFSVSALPHEQCPDRGRRWMYLESSAKPLVVLNIETWSRVCALEVYSELHPKTDSQHWPVYFRPEMDTVCVPYSFLSFNELGSWGNMKATLQKPGV
jgi:hypothetical protein